MKKALGVMLLTAIGLFAIAEKASAAVNIAVANESGTVMYTDFTPSHGPVLDSTYLVFQITNNGSTAAPDVWVTLDTSASTIISNVGSGIHELKYRISALPHGTDPVPELGLAAGQTKGVLFLVQATGETTTPQALTLKVGTTSGASDLGTFAFSFTVLSTIEANANKVTTVVTIPTNPAPGQLGRITVTGCTGTVGAGKVLYFSPVSTADWPADNFEFVNSDIQIDTYTGSPYRDVALIPNGDVKTTNNCYDEVFEFVINGPGEATTTPTNYITSGGSNVKHTTNASGSFAVTIPPPGCDQFNPITISPSSLPDAVAGVTYSQQLTASGGPAGTYAFTSTTLPGWLNLSSSGLLSGTPSGTDTGSVSFTVTATDTPTDGQNPTCTGQITYNFTVDPAEEQIPVPMVGYPVMGLLALALAGAGFLLIRKA